VVDDSAWPGTQNGAPIDRDIDQRPLPRAAPAGRLRPARGFTLGVILSTPLWVLLVFAVRSLFSWIR
jgi:hypothetical protein